MLNLFIVYDIIIYVYFYGALILFGGGFFGFFGIFGNFKKRA